MKWFWVTLALAGCGPNENSPLARRAKLVGDVSASRMGSVWVFLYQGQDLAQAPSVPVSATAISAARYASSDRQYVFGAVEPNPYRIRALVDVDRDFDPAIDVFAQPTKGDLLSGVQNVELQPGLTARVDLEVSGVTESEPPSAEILGRPETVRLNAQEVAQPQLELVATDIGGRFENPGFVFELLDGNRDGAPDDIDGDGQADMSLNFFLRWLPKPGQLASEATVVVPLVTDPRTVLQQLAGRLDTKVVLSRVSLFVVPQALRMQSGTMGLAGMPPAGDYELIALTARGQFWRLPNAVPDSGQKTRFAFP